MHGHKMHQCDDPVPNMMNFSHKHSLAYSMWYFCDNFLLSVLLA